jgi:hypothetical protein
MPSPKRPNTTRILVQVPTDVHGAADKRRRLERTTWGRVVTELLRRWSAGDDGALTAPIRKPKYVQPPPEPGSERAHYLATVEAWEREHPDLAAKGREKVDISKLPRYRSLGELLAADAAKAGRRLSPEERTALEKVGKDSDG